MIGHLSGKIISAKPTKILLDVNGVGYSVNITISTFEKISDLDTASLFIYTNVKEDSITLFGFFTDAEKEMFELLISVNGVGPKTAQSLLSGISVQDLKSAIKTSDVSRIIAAPGIGRKTAERLVLELRSKVDNISGEGIFSEAHSVNSEAVAALTTLGYNQKIAENVVRNILTSAPDVTLEDLIRKALAHFSQ
ncbi:MAG: Holliday junction DNA helicase RuvA [Ignavibacteria bacterium CG2_30_36_16]|nr:MAG: Holliday junction DNA helicase RuvA [Ignavibacteria bacterium CG2_30_36_16]PJA99430.1 MAG: Holliday junction branch migration protein RuvA [Ignavibacteria bacterium CG_4_9_14_3_um_filter_36_18]